MKNDVNTKLVSLSRVMIYMISRAIYRSQDLISAIATEKFVIQKGGKLMLYLHIIGIVICPGFRVLCHMDAKR